MPNRILKESICTSENIQKLMPEEEVFFYRLLVNCDDYGRLDGRLSVVRSRLYPLKVDEVKDDDISAWCLKLQTAELIKVYTIDNHPYIQVTKWEEHQQIRAKKSKYPEPPHNGHGTLQGDYAEIKNITKLTKCNGKSENTDSANSSIATKNITCNDNLIDITGHNIDVITATDAPKNEIRHDNDKTHISNQLITNDSKCPRNPIQSNIESNPKRNPIPETEFATIFRKYEDLTGGRINNMDVERIKVLIDEYSSEWILLAIEQANKMNHRNLSYVEGILVKSKAAGVKPGTPKSAPKPKSLYPELPKPPKEEQS